MRYIMHNTVLIASLYLFAALSATKAQQPASITTTAIGPGLRNVLIWEMLPQAKAFNIYRKDVVSASYPATPIVTVKPIKDCGAIKSILTMANIDLGQYLADSSGVPFDICLLPGLDPSSEKYRRFIFMVQGNLNLARIAGLLWEDKMVTGNKSYWYKVVAVNGGGREISTVVEDLSITTGKVELPPAPTGLVSEAGDNQIALRWTGVTNAVRFIVWRSLSPNFATAKQVNSNGIYSRTKQTLAGEVLAAPMPGFLDFQRWNASSGAPAFHEVNGNMIGGPANGIAYYYWVQAVDILGREGPISNVTRAVPEDQTAPAVPTELKVTPNNLSTSGGVSIVFDLVKMDENVHLEQGAVRHEVGRFLNSVGNPDTASCAIVATLPAGKNYTVDNYSGLRGTFGDRVWYYRVRAIDARGNKSKWSAYALATVKDLTAPSVPTGAKMKGFEKGIALVDINTVAAIDGSKVQIYRGPCDYGKASDCPPNIHNQNPCPVFVYIGSVSIDSVRRARQAGHPIFIDNTVPDGSPLCYAYWIRVVDWSGNRSGSSNNYPNAEEQAQIVCERLRDRTPPEAAIITGLFSRDKSVRIEVAIPPIQDMRGLYILRALETTAQTAPPDNAYVWIGGLVVSSDGNSLVPSDNTFAEGSTDPCSLIPSTVNWDVTNGSFMDMAVDPYKVYWYKVIVVDYEGNKTPLERAVAMSTFTYSSKTVQTPAFIRFEKDQSAGGIAIGWEPVFNPSLHQGFLLYKGLTSDGPFVQLGNLLKDNFYLDKAVVSGNKYWYKVAVVQLDGKLSSLNSRAFLVPGQ